MKDRIKKIERWGEEYLAIKVRSEEEGVLSIKRGSEVACFALKIRDKEYIAINSKDKECRTIEIEDEEYALIKMGSDEYLSIEVSGDVSLTIKVNEKEKELINVLINHGNELIISLLYPPSN